MHSAHSSSFSTSRTSAKSALWPTVAPTDSLTKPSRAVLLMSTPGRVVSFALIDWQPDAKSKLRWILIGCSLCCRHYLNRRHRQRGQRHRRRGQQMQQIQSIKHAANTRRCQTTLFNHNYSAPRVQARELVVGGATPKKNCLSAR